MLLSPKSSSLVPNRCFPFCLFITRKLRKNSSMNSVYIVRTILITNLPFHFFSIDINATYMCVCFKVISVGRVWYYGSFSLMFTNRGVSFQIQILSQGITSFLTSDIIYSYFNLERCIRTKASSLFNLEHCIMCH